MKIILNGVEKPLKAEIPVMSLLEQEGYAEKIVAVALNGAFVPRSKHAKTTVKNGDKIEIVAPMQGG
jgi:sulfur carrier protein